jgi:hypothetical protein
MDIGEHNSLHAPAKYTRIPIFIRVDDEVRARLDEIAMIENLPTNTIVEKLIMNYTPTPAPNIPGEFKAILSPQIQRLRKLKPYAVIVGLHWNKKLGMPYKAHNDLKEGRITLKEFTRNYIERLMLPDAQEEIVRLRKLRESNDIYIASFEFEEEGSIRKIFVDFVNGKLTWK